MSGYRVAIRYAKSLLSLAIETNKVEVVKRDFDHFTRLCDESRPFKLFLRNPVIPNHRKISILKKIFEGRFDLLTMNFIDIVTRKNRENFLIEIAGLFMEKYREYKGIVIARLETPLAINKNEKERIIRIINENIGQDKTVELKEKINTDLIGGYVLTIGDKQIDDSVQNKLKFFKQKLIVK